MYDDDDYIYEDGFPYGDDDYPDDDGSFIWDGDPGFDELRDEALESIRRDEIEEAKKEAFKRDILDLFIGSMVDPTAFDGADAIRLLYVFRLYRAFTKKTQNGCPPGLYTAAAMLSELYDELFPNGTY